MVKRFSVILVAAVVALAVLLPWVSNAADELAGPPEKKKQEESSKEVVVKGKLRLKVKAEKPDPDLKFDVDEIAVDYVKTENSVLDLAPTSLDQPAVTVPDTLNSEQAAAPYIKLFKTAPFLTLNPKYKSHVAIAKWRLRITDGFGNVFKDYSGNGSLPQQIVWDGLNNNRNKMIDVGTSYSYIFSIIDVASNPTSQMGKPIVLESLMYEKNNEILASVVYDGIFKKKSRRTAVSKKGELYLKEISDLLMGYRKFPLLIESYGKDIDDASYKGEIVQKQLAKNLTMPTDQFKVMPKKSRLEKIVFRIRK
jgi:hypothetical protein